MKHIWLTIILLLMCACSQRQADPFFMWSNTDAPFDTLTRNLDRAWAMCAPHDTLDSLTLRLDRLAHSGAPSVLKLSRAEYFKGRLKITYSTEKDADAYLDKAFELLSDSVAYKYEIARINYTRSVKYTDDACASYFKFQRLLDFFEEHGDRMMSALTRTAIGNVMLTLGDSVAALPYYENAITDMRELGMTQWAARFGLPMAQIYRKSNPEKADSILKSLLADKDAATDTVFYNVLLNLSYRAHNDISYVEKAIGLVKDRPDYGETVALYESYKASDMMAKGLYNDSLRSLLASSYSRLKPGGIDHVHLYVTRLCAEAYVRLGHRDSSLLLYQRYAVLADSANRINLLTEVHHNDMRQKIAASEARQRASRQTEVFQGILLFCFLVLVAGVVVFLLYRRNKLLEMQSIRSDLELEKNRRQLASSAIVMEEKDKIIDYVMNTIDTMQRDKKISSADASAFNTAIKLHKTSHKELESFQEVYSRLNPDFSRRLREDFPDLSESNIKVASYIAIGMGNRQISRVMAIEYKSVLTARHRLRKKMNLTQTESLESALLAYSEEPRVAGEG